MKKKLSVKDLDLEGKKALVRVDFNVPMEKGVVTDDTRIRASLPTIQYLLDQGAVVILMSHLGRPQGKVDPQFSLFPCSNVLSGLLQKPVLMAMDCVGHDVEKQVRDLKPGQVLLLENLRFHPGEEKPADEPGFAKKLSVLGDVYIDDAFGCAHREHASITGITQFFPGRSAAGFLLEKEIAFLGSALDNPQRPFCALLGGAKISTKFKVIKSLMEKADTLLIGGAMAFTFLKADGIPIGNSLFEPEFLDLARQLLDEPGNCRLILPIDAVMTQKIDAKAESKVVMLDSRGIPEGFQGVDIGPHTIQRFIQEIDSSLTIFWNGPLGVFECPPFATGTEAIARVIGMHPGVTIVGGGDSAAAIEQAGVAEMITHLSTGGGASLEFIEQGTLPGLEALSDKGT